MKKLKKFWQENSVLLVLFLILVACVIAISIVVSTYFMGSDTSPYGDRLVDIKDHPFDKKDQKEIIDTLEKDEEIEKASFEMKGKRIILTINFKAGTLLDDAKSKALTSLDLFSDDIKGYYDIEYQIFADKTEKVDAFKLTGSHNVGGTGGIVWVQNRVEEETEE